jgi:hypothetical protein
MRNSGNALVPSLALLFLSLATSASVHPTTQIGTGRTLPTQINLTSRQPDIVVPAGPIAGSGDFNGDGIDDLLLSVTPPLLDLTAGGIIFGGKSLDPSSGTLEVRRVDLSIAPKGPSFSLPRFRGLHAARDLNGDGIDEIVADVLNAVAPDGRKEEAAYIYFGSPSLRPGEIDLREWTPDVKIFKPSSGNLRIPFFQFEGSADVNGDGAKDLISIGLLVPQGLSIVHIILGPFASGSVVDLQSRAPDIVITADTNGISGVSVADVSGDGISDLLIGRPVDRRVDIVAGSTELRTGTEISLAQGGASAVIVGVPGRVPAIAAGDINGDRIADILVGLANRTLADGTPDPDFPGEVYVVFGSGSLLGRRISIGEGQQDVTIRGAARGSDSEFQQGDSFGSQVFAMDLNGDGISDILVEALFGEGPKNRFRDSGAAYLILGSKDLKSGTTLEVGRDEQDVKMFIEEKDAHLFFGPAFDINGDGYSDFGFVISRPRIPPPPPDSFLFNPLNIVLGGPVAPPEITKAKFQADSSELVISGANFNGAMQLEINGVLLDQRASFEPSTGRLRVEGTKRQLNLHSGKNELTVIRKGSRSNTVKVKA